MIEIEDIKKYWFAITMGLLAFAIIYISFEPAAPEIIETPKATAISGEIKEVEINKLDSDRLSKQLDSSFSHIGILKDVTGGHKILGHRTSGLARGRVLLKYNKKNNESILISTLINVPDTSNGSFYKGWIVNEDEGTYISAGTFEITKSRIINAITLKEDIRKYNRFVVTLQEGDAYQGDELHILEGGIKKN